MSYSFAAPTFRCFIKFCYIKPGKKTQETPFCVKSAWENSQGWILENLPGLAD